MVRGGRVRQGGLPSPATPGAGGLDPGLLRLCGGGGVGCFLIACCPGFALWSFDAPPATGGGRLGSAWGSVS